jgi:hypothetical protein
MNDLGRYTSFSSEGLLYDVVPLLPSSFSLQFLDLFVPCYVNFDLFNISCYRPLHYLVFHRFMLVVALLGSDAI